MPRNSPAAASILDFRPRLGNRCKLFPVNTLFRASILDFRPRLGNRCKLFSVNTLFRASILDFRVELGNRCSIIVVAVENGPPAMAVAATTFRVRFYSSLLQRRTARLLRPLRQRPSASDSILRRRNDLPHPILFFVVAKENGPPAAVVAATIFRIRFYSSLPQRRIVSPAVAVAAAIFRIRITS